MPRTRQRPQMPGHLSPTQSGDWFTFRNTSDDEAEIDIYGQIGGFSWWDDEETVTAKSFRKKLKEFKDKSKITVHINSPGGSVFEGLAIYNALKQHDAEIHVVVDALAASAASFIAMAASEGNLIMARNAVMMIHDASGVCMGNAEEMRTMSELLDKHSDNIADIYSQRTDEDAAFWRMAMVEETWYTGQEAVTAGLADGLLEDKNEEAEEAAAKFDLSIYNHAGRNQAPAPSVIHQRIKAQMKQAKENTVTTPAKPKAHGDGTGTPPATDPPTEQPPATDPPATDPPATDPPATDPPATDPPTEQPPADLANRTGAVSMVINGAVVTDPARIQAHITALETFRTDSVKAGKTAFIKQLSDDKKIIAPQIPQLEDFVSTLSDEAFDKWKATWETAPANPLLALHGQGNSNPTGEGNPAVAAHAQQIADCEEIIASLRRSNMTEEQIKATSTWAKLQQLKSTTQS